MLTRWIRWISGMYRCMISGNDHVAAGAVDFIVERYIRVVDELAFFRLFIPNASIWSNRS